MPEAGYPQRLAQAVAGEIQNEKQAKAKQFASRSVKRFFPPVAALAASLLVLVLINWLGLFKPDVVLAMEKAVARLLEL